MTDHRCPICRGSGWIYWAEDYAARKPSWTARPVEAPVDDRSSGCVWPCPECRWQDYRAEKERRLLRG